jgi:hypothetical protein
MNWTTGLSTIIYYLVLFWSLARVFHFTRQCCPLLHSLGESTYPHALSSPVNGITTHGESYFEWKTMQMPIIIKPFKTKFHALHKVKQSLCRPEQALRGPRSWGSQISRRSAHEGGKVVSSAERPPLPPGNNSGTHFCYRFRALYHIQHRSSYLTENTCTSTMKSIS